MELPDLDDLLASLNKDLSMVSNADFKSHCQKCHSAVIGESINFAQDSYNYYFHKTCFVCAECDGALDLKIPFYLHSSKPHCQACYARVVLGTCNKCTKVLEETAVIKAGDQQFHPHCFTCAGCSLKLDSKYYETPEKQFYCKNCHEKEFLPNCELCKLKIYPSSADDASVITSVLFKDKKYHENCFKCKSCHAHFSDLKVYPAGDSFFCRKCHDESIQLRAPELAVA